MLVLLKVEDLGKAVMNEKWIPHCHDGSEQFECGGSFFYDEKKFVAILHSRCRDCPFKDGDVI